MKKYYLKDSYPLYRKTAKTKKVRSARYISISVAYLQFLVQKVLEGFVVRLPKAGTLGIFGKKQKMEFTENGEVRGLAPDWKKTKDLWNKNPEAKAKKKMVFCLNIHTDGYRYKYHWSQYKVFIENKIFYSLQMSRKNKREVAARIREGQEYMVIKYDK